MADPSVATRFGHMSENDQYSIRSGLNTKEQVRQIPVFSGQILDDQIYNRPTKSSMQIR